MTNRASIPKGGVMRLEGDCFEILKDAGDAMGITNLRAVNEAIIRKYGHTWAGISPAPAPPPAPVPPPMPTANHPGAAAALKSLITKP